MFSFSQIIPLLCHTKPFHFWMTTSCESATDVSPQIHLVFVASQFVLLWLPFQHVVLVVVVVGTKIAVVLGLLDSAQACLVVVMNEKIPQLLLLFLAICVFFFCCLCAIYTFLLVVLTHFNVHDKSCNRHLKLCVDR